MNATLDYAIENLKRYTQQLTDAYVELANAYAIDASTAEGFYTRKKAINDAQGSVHRAQKSIQFCENLLSESLHA